jgi:hypothetical protein
MSGIRPIAIHTDGGYFNPLEVYHLANRLKQVEANDPTAMIEYPGIKTSGQGYEITPKRQEDQRLLEEAVWALSKDSYGTIDREHDRASCPDCLRKAEEAERDAEDRKRFA